MMISFHEGWSIGDDLETDFFSAAGFLVVAALVFLVELGLAALERVEDFFPAEVATGAGEARGDGRGDDIV